MKLYFYRFRSAPQAKKGTGAFLKAPVPFIGLDDIVGIRTVMQFASIPEAIEETRAGRMLVVVDDEDRENEGDLTIAAEKATTEAINFMATFGRGLICLTLTGERCDTLRLPLMSP